MFARSDPVSRIRWLECKNANAGTIPAFGLVRVTGANGDRLLTVDKPNADSQAVLVNGPADIPAGGQGICTRDSPADVLYDTGDGTPANGDTWGAAAGSWKLRSGKTGFAIEDAAGGRAYAENNSFVPATAASGIQPIQFYTQIVVPSGVTFKGPTLPHLEAVRGHHPSGLFMYLPAITLSAAVASGATYAYPHAFMRTAQVTELAFWTMGAGGGLGAACKVGIYANVDPGNSSFYPGALLSSSLFNNSNESLEDPFATTGDPFSNRPIYHRLALSSPLSVDPNQLYWFVVSFQAGGTVGITAMGVQDLFPIYGMNAEWLGISGSYLPAPAAAMINTSLAFSLPDPYPLTGSQMAPGNSGMNVAFPCILYALSL